MFSRKLYYASLIVVLIISLLTMLNFFRQEMMIFRPMQFSVTHAIHQNETTVIQTNSVSRRKVGTNDNQTTTFIDQRDEELSSSATIEESTVPIILRDINIVMIGDSIMRYQYLSLAYRLRHGVWFDNSRWNYDLVNEHTFENPFNNNNNTHAEFLFQTNQILQPLEVCDCYSSSRNDTLEHRYFYDPELNNSIVYLAATAAFGNNKPLMEGRLLPNQIRNQASEWRLNSFRRRKEPSWSYNNWGDVILKYVPFLDPIPKHIVMNAGIFEHDFGKSEQLTNENKVVWSQATQNLLQALANVSEFHFIWKTTTFGVNGRKSEFERDEVMCSLFQTCLNLSFTEHVRDELYWDHFHFEEPVYRVMNEKMLHLLRYLPKEYKRITLSKVLTTSTDETNANSAHHNVVNSEEDTSSISATSRAANVLRNVNIVMIGDSLMRYQYLSMVYRLRHGIWFNDSQWYYNLVDHNTFYSPFHGRKWGEFLFQTNNILHPYELCDCYRRPRDIVENRYYYDPVLNNSVVYLAAFGHMKHPIRGRILPHQVQQELKNRSSIFRHEAFQIKGPTAWYYSDWGDAILNHVRFLDPRPKYIVMNAGLHEHNFCVPRQSNHTNTSSNDFDNSRLLSNETAKLLRVVKVAPEFQLAWRTTTFGRHGYRAEFECDDAMCQVLPLCLNVSFTRNVPPDKFWDPLHFSEPLYRAMNENMLNDLGYLPDGYNQFNLSNILG